MCGGGGGTYLKMEILILKNFYIVYIHSLHVILECLYPSIQLVHIIGYDKIEGGGGRQVEIKRRGAGRERERKRERGRERHTDTHTEEVRAHPVSN